MLSFLNVRREPEHDRSAWSDLLSAFRQKVEHRWMFVLAAIAIPALCILAFIQQFSVEKDYKPPEVIYFKNWNKGRSDAEVKAQQAIDAPVERAERKALHDAEEARKAQFRKLAEQMGYDVDK
jgi:hypothetical protein